MSNHHPQQQKEEILLCVKNGESVPDISLRTGVNRKTIYAWLRTQADNTGTSNLEIAKLRRENTELKEIIGWLTLERKRGEKNQGR